MARNFSLREAAARMADRLVKDPRLTVRAALGVLLLANLVAAAAVFRPWGGSQQELQAQLASLRTEAAQRQVSLARLGKLAATVEKTKADADRFLSQYFLARRTAYSTIVGELGKLATDAGVKPKEHSFSSEPIEGSDTLGMMTITGYYEGTYADLVQFVSLLDRSPRFITIDTLQATPQQGQGTLSISLKLNVFVREEGPAQ